MTENRENMSIKYAVCVLESIGNGLTLSNENDREDACVLAIQALEEIQAYRAIGTVEELKTAMLYVSLAKIHGTVGRAIDACAEYESIGTIEEFKALKEDKNFLEFLYNQIPPNEMEQYLSMYRMKDKVAVNGYADQCGLMPAT